MLVDFKILGKHVVIVGGGAESYRKTVDFLEAGATILVVSKSFSDKIKNLAQHGKINLQQTEIKNVATFMNSLNPKPDIIVAITNDHELNAEIIKCSKTNGWIVYAPDNPVISDFVLPAVAKVGEVKIGISTGGKSPAMARVLRQRIEKLITQEDVMQIELQNYIRKILKSKVQEQDVRKELLYSVIESRDVKKTLREGKLKEAQEMAIKIIESQLTLSR